MVELILPVAAIGGMGLIFGALLAVASKIFAVSEDERIPLITEALPGANCGGCGFAGCSAYAAAVAAGEAEVGCCPVGGKVVADKIAKIMGVEAAVGEKSTAYVMCSGGSDAAKNRFETTEEIDCFTANRLGGGMKMCSYGCLGLGSCVKKCRFGAIKIDNGVAVVDRDKCTNCGACIRECPRGVIKSIPYSKAAANICVSKAAGKVVRAVCSLGCIGCGICAKNCPSEAITVSDNLAVIEPSKCIGCGICAEKCPRKIIRLFDAEPIAAAEEREAKIQIARTVEQARG